MRRIALFDMDGTLIDSGLDITISINYVRQSIYRLEPLAVQTIIDAINAHQCNLATIFYGTELYEPDAKTLFEEHYYDQCIQNVRAYDGIELMLEQLSLHDVVMGVATNAPTLFANRMLEHLGLDRFFDSIVGADRVEEPKPHPHMLYHHLHRHNFQSGTDRAWMIGDNSKDMEAASRAGIFGIFAGWGFSTTGEGDYFASSVEDVVDIIWNKGSGC
ncbi:HAD family hydrolase [Sulfuricurvum sp.]|uniref:HAD family hydrolase n=1 Tax=Sulfuricurvum sp. TaxID=2025608 RepID=UPI0019BB5963|nr:HAD family hydrolase [Sulfuricurvum sp.]MBD3798349.1 HAD family hydrolase [Campylobacterota bacterium]MBD3805590.1 HAD family hydrolase [Sulfuricurvum sp.]